MGQVFLARSGLGHLVALKVIRPEYADDPRFRARFEVETTAAARVSGNFTAPVIEADARAPRPWLAARYVPAPSLREVVRRFGVLAEPAVRALGTCLAQALKEIHERGVVHRDIKPENVLMADPRPLLIDFGISRLEEPTHLTRAGQALGSTGFMAPEQFDPEDASGPAADVFSVAAVLVFALTGQGPFGTDTTAVFSRGAEAAPDLNEVPDTLRPLIERCLSQDPAERPQPEEIIGELAGHDTSVLLTPELREEIARRQAKADALRAAPALPLSPEESAHRLRRRRFLRVAGASAVAAAGAGTLLGVRTAGRPDGESAVRPDASPSAPKLLWQTPARVYAGHSPGLEIAGDTLVLWDDSNAAGFERRTGKHLWRAQPRLPAGLLDMRTTWLGTFAGKLLGTANGDTVNYDSRDYLVGLDHAGRTAFAYPINPSLHVTGVLAATSSIALIAAGDNTVAVDLTSGRTLWSHGGGMARAHIVGDTFLSVEYGGHQLRCFELRSGRQRWVAKLADTGEPASDGTVALTASTTVQAFRMSDGRPLWHAVHQSTPLGPVSVVGTRAYVTDEYSVYALDSRTGKQLWRASGDVGGGLVYADTYGSAATSSLVALPFIDGGLAVLRARDGAVLWSREPASAGEKNYLDQWLLRAQGTTVYAASGTTLYAFGSEHRDGD